MYDDELINRAFRETMHLDEKVALEDSLELNSLPEWDSLNSLLVIRKIEDSLGTKFSFEELLEFENLGDIRSVIKRKC